MRNVILAVLVTCSALASTARAQDFDAAAKHFSLAQDAFGRKYFETAAVEFQAAYDITKDPILLFNVAEAWEKAGDGTKAVAQYKAYLKAQPNAQDKAEVQRRVRSIEAQTKKAGRLASQSAPGDAEAAKQARAALAPPPPAPVEKLPPPPVTPERTVPPPGVSPLPPPPVEKPLPPPEATPPPPAVVPPTPPPAAVEVNRGPSKMRVAAWIGVAATVATVTTAAILGLAAQSRSDEISRRFIFVDSTGQPRVFDAQQQSDYNNLKSEGQLYNDLSIAFYSVAGAFAVTTTVLFLVDWKQHKRANASALRVTPTFAKDGGGLAASFRF